MTTKIFTASFNGIDGVLVSVEIDVSSGLPGFNIVGLADIAVKESKERVRSAIINSGYEFPISRITVNLAPADLRKDGSHYDLPIAIGILLATNQVPININDNFLFLGELSLSGDLKKVRGALPIAIAGKNNGIFSHIMPSENSEECSLIDEVQLYGCLNLKGVVEVLSGRGTKVCKKRFTPHQEAPYFLDYEDVAGQESSKRAIEIAASGGHNILMFGPPGSGKSMLAKRIPGILPELSYDEALEVTKIYSVAGLMDENTSMILNRPFRSPHHTSTLISLSGGGSRLYPGEISLAHNGVLFLDEILEFKTNVLQILRQPLEDRTIKISRAAGSVTYPANIMLVASLNPCPCGYYGSASKLCTCSEFDRKRYIKKLSGPLLDRIDIFNFVGEVSLYDMRCNAQKEGSADIKERVKKARKVQENRFVGMKIYCNAQMNEKQVKEFCILKKGCEKIMDTIYSKFNLSARVYNRVLKVARTIADLNESKIIEEIHLIEALQYRKFINQEII